MRILVIIPAYNEAESIESVIANLREKAPQCDYVIVNDSSTDTTKQVCRGNHFNMLDLPINLGIGGGVQTGYLYAKENDYDVAIQMDGDGQHDPAYIANLLRPLEAGEADMVTGSRFIEKEGFQTSFMRRFGIRFIDGVIRMCSGVKITDATSGFRACNRDLIEFFSHHYVRDYPEPQAIVSAALNGYRVMEVPVMMNERQAGVSSINLWKSVYFMVKVSIDLIVYRIGMIGKRKGRVK